MENEEKAVLVEDIKTNGIYINYGYQKYYVDPECIEVDEDSETIIINDFVENSGEYSFSFESRGKLWWLCSDLRKGGAVCPEKY